MVMIWASLFHGDILFSSQFVCLPPPSISIYLRVSFQGYINGVLLLRLRDLPGRNLEMGFRRRFDESIPDVWRGGKWTVLQFYLGEVNSNSLV